MASAGTGAEAEAEPQAMDDAKEEEPKLEAEAKMEETDPQAKDDAKEEEHEEPASDVKEPEEPASPKATDAPSLPLIAAPASGSPAPVSVDPYPTPSPASGSTPTSASPSAESKLMAAHVQDNQNQWGPRDDDRLMDLVKTPQAVLHASDRDAAARRAHESLGIMRDRYCLACNLGNANDWDYWKMEDIYLQYDVVLEQFENETYIVPDGGAGTQIPIDKTPLRDLASDRASVASDTDDPVIARHTAFQAGAQALHHMRMFNSCVHAYWFQCKVLANGRALPPAIAGEPPIRAMPGSVVHPIPRPYRPTQTLAISDDEEGNVPGPAAGSASAANRPRAARGSVVSQLPKDPHAPVIGGAGTPHGPTPGPGSAPTGFQASAAYVCAEAAWVQQDGHWWHSACPGHCARRIRQLRLHAAAPAAAAAACAADAAPAPGPGPGHCQCAGGPGAACPGHCVSAPAAGAAAS